MPGTQKNPYRQASMHPDLMRRVEWVVQTFPELGYQNPADFIRAATRQLLTSAIRELHENAQVSDRVKGSKAFLKMDEARRPVEDD